MTNEETLREWEEKCREDGVGFGSFGASDIAEWWLAKLEQSHQQIFKRLKAELPKKRECSHKLKWRENMSIPIPPCVCIFGEDKGFNSYRTQALAVIDRVEESYKDNEIT